MRFVRDILLLIAIVTSQFAYAGELSPLALYNRCYSQLTGKRPAYMAPQTRAVASRAVDPIVACTNLIDRVTLSANNNTTLPDPNDTEATNLLATLHNVHSSWFLVRDFPLLDNHRSDTTKDLYDNSAPALYITRALFRSGIPYSDIVTNPKILKPVRTDMNPALSPYSRKPASAYGSPIPLVFAPKGKLLGVTNESDMVQVGTTATLNPPAPLYLYQTKGGGYLGSDPYMYLNLQTQAAQYFNVSFMPRRWGKAVFHDAFCRSLPVIRDADAAPFASPSHSLAFRKTTTCASCHASMDRISAVMRNVTYNAFDPAIADHHINYPVTRPAETSWPPQYDGEYMLRPPNGVLFFRNHKGVLVDIPVANTADLGAKMADQDDLYICAARRYYQYFTGIDADTGDIQDPAHAPLSESAKKHRETVVDLGLKLKNHQSLKMLIKDILRLPAYKNSAN